MVIYETILCEFSDVNVYKREKYQQPSRIYYKWYHVLYYVLHYYMHYITIYYILYDKISYHV